jgi:NADPH:quinone reductase-like Zn-dependent oxidoreductase
MQALIRLMARGRVQSVIHQRLPLHEAAQAHRLLERSDFFGKVVLHT